MYRVRLHRTITLKHRELNIWKDIDVPFLPIKGCSIDCWDDLFEVRNVAYYSDNKMYLVCLENLFLTEQGDIFEDKDFMDAGWSAETYAYECLTLPFEVGTP